MGHFKTLFQGQKGAAEPAGQEQVLTREPQLKKRKKSLERIHFYYKPLIFIFIYPQ